MVTTPESDSNLSDELRHIAQMARTIPGAYATLTRAADVLADVLAALLAAEPEHPEAAFDPRTIGRMREVVGGQALTDPNSAAKAICDWYERTRDAFTAYMAGDTRPTVIKIEKPAIAPEHLPVFHVVEGREIKWVKEGRRDRELIVRHWHVRVVARNGKTLLSSENYTERRGAVEAAHDLADLAGCRVVDDATGGADV